MQHFMVQHTQAVETSMLQGGCAQYRAAAHRQQGSSMPTVPLLAQHIVCVTYLAVTVRLLEKDVGPTRRVFSSILLLLLC